MDSPQYGFQTKRFKYEFETGEKLEVVDYPNFHPFLKNPQDIYSSEDFIFKQVSGKVTWKDVEEIVNMTNLPVIAKGILRPEDAIKAKAAGCKGIIVSNHGGRQLDGSPSALEVLPGIVEAVGNDLEVMMDSGISSGLNAFKAFAMGAKYVFMGKAVLWGLIVGGTEGVENVLKIVKTELERTMRLSGCPNLGDITWNSIKWKYSFSKL